MTDLVLKEKFPREFSLNRIFVCARVKSEFMFLTVFKMHSKISRNGMMDDSIHRFHFLNEFYFAFKLQTNKTNMTVKHTIKILPNNS